MAVPGQAVLPPGEEPLVPVLAALVPEEAPLVPEEAPLAQWITWKLAQEAHQRLAVVTDVNDVISLCETAIAKLEEAASTLLQETGDAAENILAAGVLVHNIFHNPVPDHGGPFQEALRDLGSVIHLGHADAHREFTDYATALGLIPGGHTWQFWDSSHALADAQARVSLEWLKAAERESLAVIRICEGEGEELLPPGERMAAAELRLQQAISRTKEALVALLAMRDTLAELEQIVIDGTADQVLPP